MFFSRSAAAGELPAGPVPYFASLDVVRFLAAAMVLFYHAHGHWATLPAVQAFTTATTKRQWAATKLHDVTNNFPAGVDLFFLLSGFLITYLLLAERARFGRIDLKAFYARRILRIWPLYYLCLAMVPVLHQYYNDRVPNMWQFVAFAGNFNLMRHGWSSIAVNHLWSICIEEHFYLIWPLLVGLAPVRRLPTIFGAVMLLSVGVRLYYFWFVPDSYMALLLHTLCRWDLLALGSLFAYAAYFRAIRLRVPRAARVLIYVGGALLFVNDAYGEWNTVFAVVTKRYLYALLAAFAIGHILYAPDAFVRWRRQTPIHYFGKISYGIYMYHGFVIFFLIREFSWFYDRFFIGWVLLFTLLLATISYELIEKPLLRLKKHVDAFRASRQPAPMVTTEAAPAAIAT
ncbi:MAG: acyltransferase [Hymenobacteraceae bacterium]|nr:acyltransferase [Hymenobacteraceae bacterium]